MVASETRALVFGHRGGGHGPENSRATVVRASELGADGVEIDVRTRGSDVVASHDAVVSAAASPDLMSLSEVVALTADLGLRLLLDVKEGPDVTADASALAKGLGAYSRLSHVTVSSFSVALLDVLRDLLPGLPLVPIVSLRQNLDLAAELDGWAGVSVLAAALAVRPDLLRLARQQGLPLYVWFGGTEWPFLVRWFATLDGVRGLIVKDVGGARRKRTPTGR